jgi:MFS-type transporter involved in bile tolerance (Atg22 family)
MTIITRQKEKMNDKKSLHLLTRNVRAYCETTTLHGFLYCVTAPRFLEKLVWTIVICVSFVCASLIINTAIKDWNKNPGVVSITTFSKVIRVLEKYK